MLPRLFGKAALGLAAAAMLLTAAPARSQSLATTFATNNNFAGNTFDLQATNPVTLTGLDVNLDNAGAVVTIAVYVRSGTCVGHENSSTGWTLWGKDTSVISAGSNNPSHVTLSGLKLDPGVVTGVYVDLEGYDGTTHILYTNGGPGTVFSNGDLAITTNSGQGNPAFTGTVFSGRQWNGRVFYKPTASQYALATHYNSNNQFAGNTFDVIAANPVTISSFDVNLTNAGSTNTVSVYYRLGTCVGHESSSSGWILLGSDPNVISAGQDLPSRARVGGLRLAPGQLYGFYVDLTSYGNGTVVRYTNGGPGTLFQNGDLKVISNSGQANPAFTGGVFPGREWNGTINYAPTPFVNGLQTEFAQNNGFAGNTFDLQANANETVDGFDVNLGTPGSTNTVTVYYRLGTCVGHEASSSGWIQLGQDTNVISNGTNVPTPVRVGGLHMQSGQVYGIYIDLTSYPSSTFFYTNGAAGTLFTDGTMRVTSNSGQNNPAFGGFNPGRIWNGRVYYHDTYCYANCDGSTAPPILNVNDFVCFQSAFAAGLPYANCDLSVSPPVLNVNDFICYQSRFAAGCP